MPRLKESRWVTELRYCTNSRIAPSVSWAVQPMIQVIKRTTKVMSAATTWLSVSEEMNNPSAMYAAPSRKRPA